jgi:hypothetical protein
MIESLHPIVSALASKFDKHSIYELTKVMQQFNVFSYKLSINFIS